ncbi:MAG TPA: hypothetical protein VD860_02190 [Azospirillum sp.]|nr:hypothetical protein [Azospirillum sp.]
MRTPDWWDWNSWIDPDDRKPVGRNEEHLIRWGLTAAVCLFLASFQPPDRVCLALGTYLLLAAMTAAMVAGRRGELPWGPHITRWDEAAASAALGLLAWIVSAVFPAFKAAGG